MDGMWQVYVEPVRFGDEFRFYFYRNAHTSGREFITGLAVETIPKGQRAPESPFSLDTASCQALMDSLWDVGFRPTEGSGSAGALAATQEHLKTATDVMNRTLALVEKQWE